MPFQRVLRLACNWREIDAGVALAGQGPRLAVRLLLQAEHISGVINLRGANMCRAWYRTEVTDCVRLGVDHLDIRLSSRQLPQRETLLSLLGAYDTLQRPILIKCAGGVDRSSFAAALYQLHIYGMAAIERVRRGLERPRLRHLYTSEQRWVRSFPGYFDATRGDRDLRGWIEEIYTAEDFERFLKARGETGTWRARPRISQAAEAAE